MLYNIEGEPIECLSTIFSLDSNLFNEYKKSNESLVIVEGNKIIAEIAPWEKLAKHKGVQKKINEYENYYTWLPFGLMVSYWKLAKLFDTTGRFNKFSHGTMPVTSL